MSNDSKKHEYLKSMSSEQKEKAAELYDAVSAFAEPDFENMPIEQVNQYLREHGYDPEQVGLRGKILTDALIEAINLKARAEAAEKRIADAISMIERELAEPPDRLSTKFANILLATLGGGEG